MTESHTGLGECSLEFHHHLAVTLMVRMSRRCTTHVALIHCPIALLHTWNLQETVVRALFMNLWSVMHILQIVNRCACWCIRWPWC